MRIWQRRQGYGKEDEGMVKQIWVWQRRQGYGKEDEGLVKQMRLW